MAQAQQPKGYAPLPRRTVMALTFQCARNCPRNLLNISSAKPFPEIQIQQLPGQSPVICVSSKCSQEAPMPTSCNLHLRDWPISGF